MTDVDFSQLGIVPDQLHGNERVLLRDFAEMVQKKFRVPRILNIGVLFGGSCHCLRVGAPDAELIGIDVLGNRFVSKPPGLRDFLNMTFIHRNSNYVELDGPFHLVFVDGGHEYEVVAEDTRRFVSKIVVGGYALYHDAGYPGIGRARREELPKCGEWELLPQSTSNFASYEKIA